MKRFSRAVARTCCVLSLLAGAGVTRAQELRRARLGDLRLERGGVIRDCVLGYRTFGKLDGSKSNVVLLPTALGWRSDGTASRVGPGKLVDSSKYYVIVVDSLGDGVSSSPSNSSSQPGPSFPEFSIRDMVNAEKRLVTEVLGLPRLLAVVGFSMGGMQAFQWAVSYPDFVDKVVSIVGSPQLTSYDRLLWRTSSLALRSDPDWAEGQYKKEPRLHLMNMLQTLVLQTPDYVATHTSRETYPAFEAELVQGPDDLDANDTLSQMTAILTMDVGSTQGGSLQKAAALVRARMLVIVNRRDLLVNSLPAREFAHLVGGRVIELDSDCGHRAHSCEGTKISQEVAGFLEQPSRP